MRKHIKKFSLLLAGVMLVGMLAGCGSKTNTTDTSKEDTTEETTETSDTTASTDEKFIVGYANSDDTDVFDKLKRDTFEEYVAKTDGVEAIFADATKDVQKQLDAIDNFIAQKVDCIIIVAVDSDGVIPGIEAANEAGIPVICVGIQANGGDFTFVGCPNVQAGEMQGTYMAENLPENAQILYLGGTPGLYHSIERREGLQTTLLDVRKDVKLLAEQTGKYERAEGQRIMEDWIQSYEKIDAVIAANDQMALGAIEALKGANRLDGVLVAGVDAVDEAVQSIKNGEMAMSCKQSAPALVEATMKVITDYQAGTEMPKEVSVDFELVTADNVDEYLK